MTSPFNIWIAGLLGIPIGLVIVIETLLVIFGYLYLFWFMLQLMIAVRTQWDETNNIFWGLLYVVVLAIVVVWAVAHVIITFGGAWPSINNAFCREAK